MARKISVLFASRAVESPPQEGGFVLLIDLAKKFTDGSRIAPATFSCTDSVTDVATEKVFTRPGWSPLVRIEFLLGLLRKAHKYDIVHTAHIPTPQNSRLIRMATRRARRKGTRFIQTVTGLPNVDMSSEELDKLLWGDYVVCQSPKVLDKVRQVRDSSSLITPWPADNRVQYNPQRRASTRKTLFPETENIVVFPGEFDRLGVDSSFAECVRVFLQYTKNSVVVLACRFDKLGTGKIIKQQFPDKVVSVGETAQIIPLLEAADLTIYPAKKMNSKFQPPLVITESLQLGTPVLVSTAIDFDKSMPDRLQTQDLVKGWAAFGKKMARIINQSHKRQVSGSTTFADMANAYRNIYLEVSGHPSKNSRL